MYTVHCTVFTEKTAHYFFKDYNGLKSRKSKICDFFCILGKHCVSKIISVMMHCELTYARSEAKVGLSTYKLILTVR